MSRTAVIVCGLLLGMGLRWAGFARPEGVRGAAGLSSRAHVRTWLDLLGLGMLLYAGLCWLAVIDVDRLRILPLDGNVLAGGALLGAAAGLSGYLPETALAGIGGGRLTESLCAAAGCVLGAFLGSLLPAAPLSGLFAPVRGTLFRLTLRDPWFLGGSFSALACLGVLLCVLSLAARPGRKRAAESDPSPVPAGDVSAQEATPEDDRSLGEMTMDDPSTAIPAPEAPATANTDAAPSVPEEPHRGPGADDPDSTGDTADLLDGAPPSPGDVFIPPIVYSGDDEPDDDDDDD